MTKRKGSEMTGIICALDIEARLIENAMKDKKVKKYNKMTFVSGKIGKEEAVISICGMGKVNAALCAQVMIFLYSPEVIINTGVAGGLSEELAVCDIAVADALYEHDLDITPLGYPIGYIAEGVTRIDADKNVSEKLYDAAKDISGIKTVMGTIVSGDQFICDNGKKKYLRDTFSAVACEMEGAAIAHACYLNGVGIAVIRAISDGASDSADMDFEEFSKKAAKNSSKVIINYLKGDIK